MLIPITLSPSSSSSNPKLPSSLARISHDEVVLIELQGLLEVEGNHPSERNGKLIGELQINDDASKPTLRIGHHLLEGKIAALPKPLAIIVRSGMNQSGNGVDNDNLGGDEDENMVQDPIDDGLEVRKVEGNMSWNIVGVVKKKIIFSKRPMPITGK